MRVCHCRNLRQWRDESVHYRMHGSLMARAAGTSVLTCSSCRPRCCWHCAASIGGGCHTCGLQCCTFRGAATASACVRAATPRLAKLFAHRRMARRMRSREDFSSPSRQYCSYSKCTAPQLQRDIPQDRNMIALPARRAKRLSRQDGLPTPNKLVTGTAADRL